MSFLAHNKNSTSLSLAQKDIASLKALAGLEAMFPVTLVTPLLLLPPHHHNHHHHPTIATSAALLGEHPRFVLPSGQTPIERHYLIHFKISHLFLTRSAFRRLYTRPKVPPIEEQQSRQESLMLRSLIRVSWQDENPRYSQTWKNYNPANSSSATNSKSFKHTSHLL